MITERILDAFFGLINSTLNFFPPILLPIEIVGGLSAIIELFATASYFLPVGTLQIAIATWLLYYNFKLGVVILNWIISKIPTIT